ncbi:site-specific tyrosine recombinase XerD [compost metagenome]
MPTKKTSLNNSLLLRGNTWYIHWNVPTALRNNPHFKGKKIYSKTLQTKDVYEARKMRDLLVSKFRAMADLSTTYAARRAFISHLAEASKAVEETKQKLIYLDGEKAFNAWDDLESAFNVAAVIEKGDFTRADAYLVAIHDKPEVAEKYTITLKDAVWDFLKAHEGKIATATISRTKRATESLIKAIGQKDVKLKDVTSRQVTRWIKAISTEFSDSTRSGFLAALNKMWFWTWEHEHVDGVSPFKGIKMERQGDGTSYQEFTGKELQAIIARAEPAVLLLMRFGLITGCRVSELVGLTPASFSVVDGVHVVQIFKGKTDAAARMIPLPVPMWNELKAVVVAGTWEGRTSAIWASRFGETKEKVTGRRDRDKVFHSFRHMAATAYEREHIEERITSVLLGHKNKRGESMSYGLYSAGLSPKQYLEAVEKMLAGEYMQSFLRLFK